jgi:tRNA dimethylallyltransferase
MNEKRPILMAGPTASGKSGLALRLAESLGGIVVNADSMQVYRELRILTARPSVADEARVPHALYGFVAGHEAYSAGRFASDAARVLTEARASGLRPIIV